MATIYTYALTTVADVKETLGIDAGDTSKDNLIVRKINQATDMIEAYCGLGNAATNVHHFASTTYTNEEYNGTGTKQLILKSRPITTFTQLQQRDTRENDDSWETVDTELYFIDNASGTLETLFILQGYWKLYRATYTAGYTTIPADLGEAAATLAAFLVDNAATGTGVKRKEQGPKEIEYFPSNQSGSIIENLGIDNMLARYADIAVLEDM